MSNRRGRCLIPIPGARARDPGDTFPYERVWCAGPKVQNSTWCVWLWVPAMGSFGWIPVSKSRDAGPMCVQGAAPVCATTNASEEHFAARRKDWRAILPSIRRVTRTLTQQNRLTTLPDDSMGRDSRGPEPSPFPTAAGKRDAHGAERDVAIRPARGKVSWGV